MQSEYSFAERKKFTEYLRPDNQTMLGELTTDGNETHTEDYDTDYSCLGYYYTSSIIFSSKLFLFTSVAFVIMGIIGNSINIIVMSQFLVISASIAPHHFMMVGSYYHWCAIDLNWQTTYSNIDIIESTIYKIVAVFAIAICNVLIIYQIARKSGIEARGRNEARGNAQYFMYL